MMRRLLPALAGVLLVLATAFPALAQSPPTCTITGTVYLANGAVAATGTKVTFSSIGTQVITGPYTIAPSRWSVVVDGGGSIGSVVLPRNLTVQVEIGRDLPKKIGVPDAASATLSTLLAAYTPPLPVGAVNKVWSQCSGGDCNALVADSGDSLNAAAASSTLPVRVQAGAPSGACTVGTMVWNSSAVSGQNLIGCTNAGGTWTVMTGGGGGGSSAFDAITSGTNTAAAMLVGTGASLGVSGSGTIAATTAAALAANGGDCPAGQAPRGVDAAGAVENCTVYLTSEVDGSTSNEINTFTADSGGATTGLGVTVAGGSGIATTRSSNTVTIATASSEGSFLTGSTTLPGTCSEGAVYQDTDSGGTETYTCTATNTWTKYLGPTDNAATATALSGNPANCSAGQAPRGIDEFGAPENCTAYLTSEVDGSTSNEINTFTADSGGATTGLGVTVTGGAGIATTRSGDTVTVATASSEGSFLTGSTTLPGTCSEGAVYQDTDSGGAEAYVCTATNTWTKLVTSTDNVATATALAANPTDCGANQFATTIAASGNLTCAQPTEANVSGIITDVFGCTSGDCNNIAVADGEHLNFAAVNPNTTTEGLTLPQATACSSATAEGQVCWDTDMDHLYVGRGAGLVRQIDGPTAVPLAIYTQTKIGPNAVFWMGLGGVAGTGELDVQMPIGPGYLTNFRCVATAAPAGTTPGATARIRLGTCGSAPFTPGSTLELTTITEAWTTPDTDIVTVGANQCMAVRGTTASGNTNDFGINCLVDWINGS